jgi:hypothetical protein
MFQFSGISTRNKFSIQQRRDDYITKLCRTQAEEILNHINTNVRVLKTEKPGIGSLRGLNFEAVRLTTVQLTNCSFRVVT